MIAHEINVGKCRFEIVPATEEIERKGWKLSRLLCRWRREWRRWEEEKERERENERERIRESEIAIEYEKDSVRTR